jgi:ABC-type nitrate/sulfonate/bicarbonate transport system substrate-binding protein
MKLKLFLVTVLIVVVLLSSCAEEETYAGEVEEITFAASGGGLSAIVFIALDQGYFQDEGLDVTIQLHGSGKASLDSVIEGNAHVATVADIPVMHAGLNKEKIYLLATVQHSEKDTVMVARKDKGISQPLDLTGKKIGVKKGTSGEFFLDTLLTTSGIPKIDVEIINLTPQEMVDALTTEEFDAVVTWSPFVYELQQELGDNGVIFDGEGVYTQAWNIVARQDFVNKNPELIKKIVSGLLKAEKFARENPGESQIITAEYTEIDIDLLKETWDVFSSIQVSLDQLLLITLEGQARWAIKNNLTSATEVPNYLDYIYFDALDEVKPEAVTIIH